MKLPIVLATAITVALLLICVTAAPAGANGYTVFCEEHKATCPPNEYNGTVIRLAKDFKVLSAIGDVTCGHSEKEGKPTGLRNPLLFNLTSLEFGECSLGAAPCELTAVKLGQISYLRTGLDLAILTVPAGSADVLVDCGVLMHCVYGGAYAYHFNGGVAVNHTTGASSVEEAEEAELNSVSGFLCPDQAFLDATYYLVSPLELHVAE